MTLIRAPLGWHAGALAVSPSAGLPGLRRIGRHRFRSRPRRRSGAGTAAVPDALPVALVGDGDFLMGVTALWTAVHHRIPALVMIANNTSYFVDEEHQRTVSRQRGAARKRVDRPAPRRPSDRSSGDGARARVLGRARRAALRPDGRYRAWNCRRRCRRVSRDRREDPARLHGSSRMMESTMQSHSPSHRSGPIDLRPIAPQIGVELVGVGSRAADRRRHVCRHCAPRGSSTRSCSCEDRNIFGPRISSRSPAVLVTSTSTISRNTASPAIPRSRWCRTSRKATAMSARRRRAANGTAMRSTCVDRRRRRCSGRRRFRPADGNTCFANMVAAYRELDPALRQRIDAACDQFQPRPRVCALPSRAAAAVG